MGNASTVEIRDACKQSEVSVSPRRPLIRTSARNLRATFTQTRGRKLQLGIDIRIDACAKRACTSAQPGNDRALPTDPWHRAPPAAAANIAQRYQLTGVSIPSPFSRLVTEDWNLGPCA